MAEEVALCLTNIPIQQKFMDKFFVRTQKQTERLLQPRRMRKPDSPRRGEIQNNLSLTKALSEILPQALYHMNTKVEDTCIENYKTLMKEMREGKNK